MNQLQCITPMSTRKCWRKSLKSQPNSTITSVYFDNKTEITFRRWQPNEILYVDKATTAFCIRVIMPAAHSTTTWTNWAVCLSPNPTWRKGDSCTKSISTYTKGTRESCSIFSRRFSRSILTIMLRKCKIEISTCSYITIRNSTSRRRANLYKNKSTKRRMNNMKMRLKSKGLCSI